MLHHVSLETAAADAGALVAFFELLGFAEAPVPEGLRGASRWVQRGATQVHLLVADQPVVPPSGHCAVVCERYEATLDALRSAGFEPEPRREHWGAARCFVRAPGGHRVEVMAAAPA